MVIGEYSILAADQIRKIQCWRSADHAPDQISVVVITHMHGDHVGGLMEGGAPAFKYARYVAGQAEVDFWKDEARVGAPAAEGGHKGVLKNVVPLADKMTFIGEWSSSSNRRAKGWC